MFLPICGSDQTAFNLSGILQEDITVKENLQHDLWNANSADVPSLHRPPGLPVAIQPPADSSSGARQVLNTAAVTIQAAVRGYLSRQRRQQLKSAAVLIQARWRGHTCHKNFRLLRDVATIVQAEGDFKGCLSHNHVLQLEVEVRRFRRMTRAATRVQAAFRGYWTRQQLLMLHNAATKIQTAVRGHVCRQRWLRLQPTAAVTNFRREWQRKKPRQV